MIPVSLSLKNKSVCIVGAGKVGYRKALQLLEEGAIVTVVSPYFLDSFQELDIIKIHDEYQKKYIENMFLVYSATCTRNINHQVIKDCQEMNILCGSASYDDEASFYSMATYQHELGMIALSTYQKLPYSKPLLKDMSMVLDNQKERIILLEKLRPFILQYVEDTRAYFHQLMEIDMKILEFLYQSLISFQGVFFVYHHSDYTKSYHFNYPCSLTLSLQEFKECYHLFVFPINYEVVPLLLSDGVIYRQLKQLIPKQWKYHDPLLYDDKDFQHVVSLTQDQKKFTIYIIHPRTDQLLKRKIQSLITNGKVYDFNEYIMLSLEQKYKIVFLLMTHGQHYQNLIKKMQYYQSMGYQIEYSDVLLENKEIRKYIELKVKNQNER